MFKFLSLLIVFCIPQAQATSPLNATVCAHILSAAARLPLKQIATDDIPKILEILARLHQDPEFERPRLNDIRQALHDPTSEVFHFEFSDVEKGDDFIAQLVYRLELAEKHRRPNDKRLIRRSTRFWRNLVIRNPLLHIDQLYRIARHSDPSAIAELQQMTLPTRSEHFERDYDLHEIQSRAGLPRPTSRQGRIDTAAYIERLWRRLLGDPFPHLVDRKVSVDIFLEDPPRLSIFVRMKKIKPI